MYRSYHAKRKSKGITPYFVRRLSSWLVLSTALTVSASKVAQAATYYWDADGTSSGNNVNGTGLGGAGIWNTTNLLWWDGTLTDQAWVNGTDTGVFTGTGGTVTVGSPVTAAGLLFNVGEYYLTSDTAQTLTLGTGGITIDAAAASGNTVGSGNLSIAMSGAQSWVNNSSSLLTVAGAINNGGFLLTLSNTSTGGETLTGVISGAGGITVNSSGGGAVTLSGANTYTGQTNITSGTLKLGASASTNTAGPLGTTAAGTVVSSGGTLDLNGYSFTGTATEALTVGGSGVGGGGALVNNGSGLSSFIGTVTLNGDTTIGGTGQIQLTGGALAESTTGTLIKTGTGIAIFSNTANATRTGATRIDQGTLRLAAGAGISPLSTTGAIILNGGILSLAPTAASVVSTQNVQLNTASNTIVTDASAAANTMTLGTLTFNSGANALTFMPGPVQAVSAGTAVTMGATFGATTLDGNTTFTIVNNNDRGAATLTLGALSASGKTITKEGGGTLVFNANATAAPAALTVNRGGVTTTSGTALGSTAAVTVNNNATWTENTAVQSIGSLSGAGNAVLTSNLTIAPSAATTTTFAGLATFTGVVEVNGSATGVQAFSGPNTGAGGVKITSGTLRALDLTTALGTGTVNLNGGILDLRANTTQTYGFGAATVNATSTINVQNNGAGLNNVFTIGSLTFTGATGLNVTGANGSWLNTTTVALTNANQGIDVASGVTLQFGGIVSGTAFGITKNNSGTLILAGANTYTGATTLNAGTLRGLVAASFGAAGAGLNLNGGTLELLANASTTFTNTNTTVGASSSVIVTSDVLTGLSGISGYGNGYSNAQPVGISSVGHTLGTLALGLGSTITVNSANYDGIGVTFATTATVTGNSSSHSVLNVGSTASQYTQVTLGALTMAGANVLDINSAGTGTVVLGTAGAFSTNTSIVNVNGGTLRIATAATALGTAAGTQTNVIVNSGGTLEISAITPTFGIITLNSGATLRGVGASGINTATAPSIASGATGVKIQTGTSSIAFNSAATGDVFTISNGLVFGATPAAVTVSGNGRVILSAGATNDGTWTQTSGILQLGSATSLGATGAASINVTGGILGAGATALTVATPITLGGGALAGSVGGAVTETYSGTVTLANGTTSTIAVGDPTALSTARTITISGKLTGSGDLVVGGLAAPTGLAPAAASLLNLQNVASDNSGGLTIANATVDVGGGTGTGKYTGTGPITLSQNGVLNIDNTGAAANDGSRMSLANLTSTGGSITLTTVNVAGNVTQSLGTLTLNGSDTTITVNRAGTTAGTITLQFTTDPNSNPARSNGAVINFVATGSGTLGGGASSPNATFSGGAPVLNDGLLGGWATVGGVDFATYGANGIAAASYAATTLVTSTLASDNISATATPSDTITGKTINALKLSTAAVTVQMRTASDVLTIDTGGILASGAFTHTISGGSLTSGGSELFLNAASGTTLVINSQMTGAGVSVIKAGAGTVQVHSASLGGTPANTFGGTLYVNQGTLTLARAPGLNAASGSALVVQAGNVTLSNAEQINDAADVTLKDLNGLATDPLTLAGAGLNETVHSLTLTSTTSGKGVSGAATLILTSTDTNALTVTGGTIASPLRFSGTSGGGIAFVAPATALAPTAATTGGPYQTTIGGAVDLNSSGTALTRTINVGDGPALIDLNFTGALTASGAQTGINKTGSGTMRIGVASTYTGLTTVTAGTLSFNIANALGLGGLTVNGGTAQFDITAAVNTLPITTTVPNLAPVTVTVNGGTLEFNNVASTTFGKLIYTGGTINAPTTGTLTLQNPLNNTSILQFDSTAGALTLRGNINLGAAAVVNNVTATGSNTVTLAGALALGSGPRNFIVDTGANLDVTAAITGTAILVKSGAGTMKLSGGLASQNTNSGTVLVTEGTLALNKDGVYGSGGGVAIGTGALIIGGTTGTTVATVRLDKDEQIANASAITINAGGTLSLQSFSETIGAVTMNSVGNTGGSITGTSGTLYTGAISMTGGSIGLSSGTVFLGGNVTATSGSASNIATLSGNLNLGSATRTFTVNAGLTGAASDLNVTGVIAGNNIGVSKTGFGVMTLSGANTYTGATTITNGTLVMATGGSLSTNSAVLLTTTAMANTVNPTFDISAGNQTIGSLTGGAGGSATAPFVTGRVNIGSSTLTVGSDETSPAAFVGAIVGTTGGLTKTGTGAFTIANAAFSNSYSGATTINAGTLMLAAPTNNVGVVNALPTTTAVTVNSGGTLFLQGQGTGIVSQTLQSLQLNAGGTLNGGLSQLTINRDGSSTTLDGAIHGTFTLNKVGAGDVTITGSQNTFNGVVVANQGRVILSGNGTLPTIAATNTYVVNNGGTLRLDNSGTNLNDRLAATATMTLDGGTFEIVGKNGAASGEQLGALTLNTGASTINIVNGSGAGSSTQVVFNAAITRTAGTLNITSSGFGTLGAANSAPRVLFVGATNNSVLSGVIVGGNSMAFYDQTLGVRALSLAEETEINLSLDQAALTTPANNLKFVAATANQTLGISRTINSLTIDNQGSGKFIDVGANSGFGAVLTVTTGNIIFNGTDSFEIKRSAAPYLPSLASSLTATSNPVTVWVNNSGATMTISAPISGGNAFNKSGAGTLVLSGANTYTGTTFLNEGTLKMGANNTLYSGATAPGALTINNANAVLDINGFSNTVAALSVISGSIVNSGSGGSLTATGGLTLGTASAVGGAYGSALSINTGTGVLNLGGNITYAVSNDPNGATIAGNLALGYDLITTGVARISSGATRTFTVGDSVAVSATGNANPDLTVSAVVSGIGLGVTKAGTGTMLLSGANTYTGPTTVSVGQLIVGNSSALGDNTVLRQAQVSSGATLGVQGGLSFNANTVLNLTGTGLAVTEGDLAFAGALNNINGNNSFAGMVVMPTAVGTALTVVKSSSAGDTLTLSGEVVHGALAPGLVLLGAGNVTLSGGIDIGTGTLTVSSTNSTPANATFTLGGSAQNYYTGATTINAGTVALNKSPSGLGALNPNAIGIGALTVGLASGGPAAIVSYTGTSNDQINDYTAITLNQSGRINMNGVSDTIGSLASAAVYGSLIAVPGSPTAALNAGIPLVNGVIDLGTTAGTTLTIGAAGTSTSFGGVIQGTGNLVKIGIGVQSLTNVSTYSGSTTLTHGGITLLYNNALPTGTALTVNSPTAGALTLSGFSQTVASLSGVGTIALANTSGGYLTFGGDNSSTSFDGTISGTLLSTEGGLVKNGSGTFTLTGANTFTTNFRLNNGTLVGKDLSASIGNAAPIWLNASNSAVTLSLLANTTQGMGGAGAPINVTGSGNAVTINVNNNGGSASGNILTLSTLNMGGQTLAITGGNSYGVRFSGAVTLTPDTNTTFDVGTGLSMELAGAIALTNGSITKNGNGLLILSGTNTQTGRVILNGGTMRVTAAGALGASLSPNALTLTSGTLDIRGATLALGRNTLVNGDVTINADPLTGITGYAGAGQQPVNGTPAVLHALGTLSMGTNTLSITTTQVGALSTGAGLSFAGLTTLTGNPTFNVGANGFLQLSQINGSGFGFTKSGNGILNLSGPSSTSGPITVDGGILRITQALATASPSTIALGTSATTINAAGTLEINGIASSVGVTSGTIVLAQSGATLRGVGALAGFTGLSNPITVASGANVNIQTGNSAMGSTGFNGADVFTIGTSTFGASGGTTPTSGGLGGGGSGATITISGQGKVVLASNTSTVDATWIVNSGVLQLGNTTVATANVLGAATSTVTVNSGGMLASGAIATTYANDITLNGGSLAGSTTAAIIPTYANGKTVTLQSGSTSTVYLGDIIGAATVATSNRDIVIAGKLTGSGNLLVSSMSTVTPTLSLTGTTTSDFTGALTITNGLATFGTGTVGTGSWTPLSGTPQITLNQNGRLTVDNTAADIANRVAALPVDMRGGALSVLSRNLAAVGLTQSFGAITFGASGANTITLGRGTSGNQDVTLTLASIDQVGRAEGSTINFAPANANGNLGKVNAGTFDPSIIISAAPTLKNGIIGGWATAQDTSAGTTEFAAYQVSGTANGVGALNATGFDPGTTISTNLNTAAAANNVRITATPGANVTTRTINSLNVVAGAATTVTITAANILTVGDNTGGAFSGGIISQGAFNNVITGGTLTSGGTELFINTVAGAQSLSIASVIDKGTNASVALVKWGPGNLILNGTASNTYGGTTYVNGGTLTLSNTTNTDSIPADLIINGGAATTTIAGVINDNSNVTINGLGTALVNATNTFGILTIGAAEKINSLTINAINGSGANNVATGAFTLTLGSSGTNALVMTGGTINLNAAAAVLAFSGTSGGGILIKAPATALDPTALTSGISTAGAYQAVITGTAGSTINLNNTGTALTRIITVEDGPAPIDFLINTGTVLTSTSGTTSIQKEGAGTMRILTASTYSGSTVVNAGTLSLAIANATPVTASGSNAAGVNTTIGSNVVIVNGGNLNLEGVAGIGTGANLAVAGGTVNFNNTAQGIRGLSYTGGVINAPLSAALTITPTTNNDYALQIGPVSPASNGLNLTGNLAIGGTTTGNILQSTASATSNVIGGALSLSTVIRTFDVADGTAAVDLDVSAAMSGAAGGFIKIGAGTMQLSGGFTGNNSYTGATTVNAGTLVLNKTGLVMGAGTGGVAIPGALTIGDNSGTDVVRLDADEQIANAAAVTINSSGLLNLNGKSETIAALSIGAAGNAGGSLTNGGGSTGSTLYTTGTITLNGGVINLDGTGTGKLVLTGGAITTGANTTSNTVTASSIIMPVATTFTTGAGDTLTINGNISGYDLGVTKAGAGTLILNGTNTWNGTTAISGGILRLGSGGALSSETTVTITGTTTLDINGQTAAIGSVASASAVGTISLNNATTAGSLTVGSDDTSVSYGGTIVDGGSVTGGSVTKVGVGTLTIIGTAANTYTGTTTVTAGKLILGKTAPSVNAIGGNLIIGPASGGTGTQTVQLAAAAANNDQIPNTATVTVNASGIFDINLVPETIGNLAGSGLVTNTNATGAALTIAPADGNSQTFSGIINANTPGSLSLTFAGTGTTGSLTLSGTQTNNFTGATSVSGGILILAKTGPTVSAIPSTAVTIGTAGKIQFATGSGANQLSNAFINGTNYASNTVTVNSGGALDVNGVSAVMGALTVATGGSLLNSGGTATLKFGAATPTITLDNAITLPSNLSFAFTNPGATAGGFTTNGSAATATTLTIGGGIDLNATAATGATRTFTILDSAAAIDVDITGVVSNSGGAPTGLTKATAGSVLQLSNTNTYTGATTVSAGTLKANATNALGSTSAVTITTGAFLDISGFSQSIGSLTGAGSLTFGTGNTLTVGTDNTTPAAYSGTITGSGTLTKTGSGTLAITGANAATLNWTGAQAVRIQGGTLNINADAALGAAPNSAVANNIVIESAVLGDTTTATLNANRGITLGGTFAGIDVAASQTFTIAGNITGSVPLIKTSTGTLVLAGTNAITGGVVIGGGTLQASGLAAINNQNVTLNGSLTLLFDGDGGTAYTNGNGIGSPQTIAYTGDIAVPVSGTITLGRLGTSYAPLFTQAANKTLNLTGNLTLGSGQTLTIAPGAAGYGLLLSTGLALSPTTNTISVGQATASNVVQGFTINGQVTGGATGAGVFTFSKTGVGTLVLGNATNSFGGSGSVVDISGGVLQVGSDGALGNSANVVRINSATQALRVTGSFATNRTINLAITGGGIDVTAGNTLTLNTAFTGLGTATFAKADNGTLAFISTVNNSGFTGAWTISAGAIQITANQNLNNAANNVTVSATVGSALQLVGGVTLNKSTGVISLTGSGINTGGALESVSGTNNVTSALTLAAAATIGADAGSTLNISAGFLGGQALTVNTIGTGAINFTGAVGTAAVPNGITKIGSGTATLSAASTAYTGALTVNAGAFTIAGTGAQLGSGAITVNPGGTLNVSDAGTVLNNRAGGRTLTLNNGTFNYTVNSGPSATSSESFGALTVSSGSNTINVNNPGSQASTLNFLTITNFTSTLNGSSLDFTGALGTANNKITFGTAPGMTNNIIPRTTVNGTDFATYNTDGATGNSNGLQAFTAYSTAASLDIAAFLTPTATYKATSDQTLTTSRTVGSPGTELEFAL